MLTKFLVTKVTISAGTATHKPLTRNLKFVSRSQNHGTVGVRRHVKGHPIPPSCYGQGHFPLSSLVSDTPRDGGVALK